MKSAPFKSISTNDALFPEFNELDELQKHSATLSIKWNKIYIYKMEHHVRGFWHQVYKARSEHGEKLAIPSLLVLPATHDIKIHQQDGLAYLYLLPKIIHFKTLTPISFRICMTSFIWFLSQITGFIPNSTTMFFKAKTAFDRNGINTAVRQKINSIKKCSKTCVKRPLKKLTKQRMFKTNGS